MEEAGRRHGAVVAEKDNTIINLNNQLTTANTNCGNFEKQVNTLAIELTAFKENVRHLQGNLSVTTEECIKLNKDEESRKHDHAKQMSTLEKFREQIQSDRENEVEKEHQEEIDRIEKLKETWRNHQSIVKNRIKSICNFHTIEYVDKVPFKGEPDNCIKICEEFLVFDAKSPGGEDISNFFTYLKDQAERARKYAMQENVKIDIFFVVPSNTWEVIKQSVFHLGDYNVYIISADSLEPIILSLKKIESYEFAQQLSPEERENICRIIGKFAHLTKRRIQIDSFFARQFIELVYKCESNLPEDIKKDVAAFERSEKLNPPMEKRAKAINNKELELDVDQVEMEVLSTGIVTEDLSQELNKVRLYKE